MTTLTAGANVPVPAGNLTLVVRWAADPHPHGGPAVDASALLVTAAGRVRTDDDFVSCNRPQAAGGAVAHHAGQAGTEYLTVRPDALPGDIDRLVVAASVRSGTFGSVVGLALDLVDASGTPVATYPVGARGTEAVLVLGELYRRQGGWKLRAIGQGYDSGLAGLATDYGVTIGDGEPRAEHPAAPGDADTAGLPPQMGAMVSPRKETVQLTLEKKGIGGVRARVAVVLDRSGSMKNLYGEGTVGRLIERMAPVAAKLDSDGSLDAWIFADRFARLPSVRVPDLARWIETHVYISSKGRQLPPLPGGGERHPDDLAHVFGGNNEPPVIRDIIDYYSAHPGDPVLVLFFSDGGITKGTKIGAHLKSASVLPIFWQFVGLGNADYGVLERFDTLRGRAVDNAGFFSVDDVDQVGDAELYDRLLGEFPHWLAAARACGIVR
ncbi:vWA domain-containing protein [Yinghuangia soli]|uniref:VWA domain-containing protein n=1 Tax=Yinghuangia soli TaxID=2908204 RepID=A0AA41U2I0_9ACTN|nr:VWA domain-containing protein [Yinghuangia soli]MCF2530716.1 VWA domain-containing protein [Yinghuangia soli]